MLSRSKKSSTTSRSKNPQTSRSGTWQGEIPGTFPVPDPGALPGGNRFHTTMKTLNEGETGATAALEPNSRTRPFTKSELRKQDRQETFERIAKSATVAVMY